MDSYQVYILISVLVLAVIAVFLYGVSRNKQKKGLTWLAALSFGFIIAGIMFGGHRLVGYSLLGIGIILAVIDCIKRCHSVNCAAAMKLRSEDRPFPYFRTDRLSPTADLIVNVVTGTFRPGCCADPGIKPSKTGAWNLFSPLNS